MMSTVGVSTIDFPFWSRTGCSFPGSFPWLGTAIYFLRGGCGAVSEAHSGAPETSNSGADDGLAPWRGRVAAIDEPPAAAAAWASGAGLGGAAEPDFAEPGFAEPGFASPAFADAGFRAPGFAEATAPPLAVASADLPRPNACSTDARKSTSMRSGDPDEYSAWNITFHDWQIMRSRTIGSCAENCARRQSSVVMPRSSNSVKPSRIKFRSPSISRKKARRIRYPNRVNAASATGR